MNLLLFFGLYYAALFVSCSFVTESCPVIHKGSEITIREHAVMYKHVVEYCKVEEIIYSVHSDMIQEWMKANPNKLVCHTFWGSFQWESRIGMYIIHIFIGIMGLGIWIIVDDENNHNRRR